MKDNQGQMNSNQNPREVALRNHMITGFLEFALRDSTKKCVVVLNDGQATTERPSELAERTSKKKELRVVSLTFPPLQRHSCVVC